MELTVNGKRAFAATGGRAFDLALPTVALLHGAGMEHSIWALQSRALAHHGRNVVALDFPGHGRSDGPPLATVEALADWVLAALKAVGATQFRLAGHSFGALVALETASRAGSSCERLALVGFAPEMRVHPDLLGAARAGAHLAAELMVAWSFGLGGLTGGNPAPGLFLPESALRLIERAPAASLAADLAACDAYRGSLAAAQRVSCSVLLLLGDQDGMTPARHGEAFARHFAQAQVKILRHTGHMMMVEQPRATLDSLFAAL
ncbi:MAG TPA: alpha/beta fold hydrolase [Stellaceae bacterium]|nr:alpha/beta fold hydrolase [Stellaceae bacterium]